MPNQLNRRGLLMVAILTLVSGYVAAAEATAIPLVPPPQEVSWSAGEPIRLSPDAVAIVVGKQASDPERYAAERLQAKVARRFGQQWAIVSEQDAPDARSVRVLLGQRTTHGLLDRVCRENAIRLDDEQPGHDGYVIQMLDDRSGHLVLVGGSNARGVIYGQDTLFQLIQGTGSRVALLRAAVRDWPTVPWRGRPQTQFTHYLRPGDWDCCLDARINFIDLRNGIYAFEPGADLDKPKMREVTTQAHQRGLIVYATVNCGVEKKDYPEVLKTYEEMVELGADGLWMSFDDKGPGDEPESVVRQVVALGKRHGIAGSRIVMGPPKGSYQDIDTAFNRTMAAIDGMEQALWFWSRLPGKAFLEQARSIGLETKPAWWHNWPRMYRHHAYVEPVSMSVGWHAPTYGLLKVEGDCIDGVMPWGGNAWGQYYVVPSLGWWAWNPGDYDWTQAKARIYDAVFGPEMVGTAAAFDDTLVQARGYLQYGSEAGEWKPYCSMRLKDPSDRNRVLSLTGRMQMLLTKLEKRSEAGTLIPPAVLKEHYLDRMPKEIGNIEAAARLPFPEYWWIDHQEQVLSAVYDGDLSRADALIEKVRGQLLKGLAGIAAASEAISGADRYVAWWTKRAHLDAAGWRQLVDARQAELTERLEEYAWNVAVPEKLIAPLSEPPLDRGTGRWQDANRVLATVVPSNREYAWSNWIAGVRSIAGHEVATFAARRKSGASPGEFCELEVTIPVPACRRDRLALMMFVNSANKDDIGLQHVVDRWAGYRFIELRWGNTILWEADLGLTREQGRWDMVHLPTIPEDIEELKLRLRVVDRKLVTVNHTIAFVGPIRLIERQECVDGL